MVVAVIVVASFAFASYSLKVSFDSRNQAIKRNAARTLENRQQLMRACERISVIVQELDRVTPDFQLRNKLRHVDDDYPNLDPCFKP